MDDQDVKQIVVSQTTMDSNQISEKAALFNEAGTPVGYFTEESVTGADVLLTGYTSGTATPVAASDTANQAIAKVEAQAAVHETGADILLTGLASGSAVAIAATDTVNQAMAKLQAQIDALS